MPIGRRSGTQSIERCGMILRTLALRGSIGWRLVDLSAHCELDKGTTHRILSSLVRERLVQQRESDRRYVLGPLLFELGLAVPALAALQAACAAPLSRVANRFGGVSMFYLRSGAEFVCAARTTNVTLAALTVDVGTRRPLIVSAGGVAILIALPPAEAKRIVALNMEYIERFSRQRIAAIKRVLRQSRRCGFGVSRGEIVPGVSAYGVAIRNTLGVPFASISLVGTTASFPSTRISEIIKVLEQESSFIAREAGLHTVQAK